MGLSACVPKDNLPYLYDPETQPLQRTEGWSGVDFSDLRTASTPEFAA